MIYFFFPETARLTLEEIAKNFGEEVAVHITDVADDEERGRIERNIATADSEKTPEVAEGAQKEAGTPETG